MVTTLTQAGSAPERVKFFDSQIIMAADMITEQTYFLQKLRRHNRFLHGWGVVYGLEVSAAPTTDEPGRVRIDCGYALSPEGDEIYVAKPFCFDLLRCSLGTVSDPCEPRLTTVRPAGESLRLYLAVRYTECATRPVRLHPSNCGCDASGCAYSRIRDDYAVECLLELPASHQPQPGPSLCELRQAERVPACPPCPEEPWVVIAAVDWNPRQAIAEANINNLVRRQLYSTAILQAQVIDCCCGKAPARVTSIQPADGSIFTLSEDRDEVNLPPDEVIVRFDKALQPDTVNEKSFQLRFQAGDNEWRPLEGEVTYQKAANAARFTPRQPFPKLGIQFGWPVKLLVRVRGNGDNAIRDVENMILDGDGDGAEGGDFTSRFETQAV